MEKTQTKTKLLYTAKTHTTGGRDHGVARSSDGHLEVTLNEPGSGGSGTNPEQLFAAGWSACFESAMKIMANKLRVTLPENAAIDAEVDLLLVDGNFTLGARLNVSLPGLDREVAQSIVDGSQNLCPYSRAIHGNVDVEYNLV